MLEIPYAKSNLNWVDKKRHSTLEMNDPSSRPTIAKKVPDMEKHDMILLGFSICGGMWHL